MPGTVYLLHFDEPLAHAQHYLGWSSRVIDRVNKHLSGAGSKLARAFSGAGIGGELVRTWAGDRKLERSLKERKNARGLCPKCKAAFNARAAANMRRYRGRP